ncbi:MAG: glycine dehydrogenase (aminomethyl-transferring) [Deltaproteobacteria bacterium]|nr:MAG: glycine dehydrogenase (aminomethyl-transferring) [Deltaproteobacteria bacterium]
MTHDVFASRHLGPRTHELQHMLDTVGATSLDELIEQTIPAKIRVAQELDLPAPLTEREATQVLAEMAASNAPRRSWIGTGYHGTITPPVILRNILENPGWYTAYTPYQSEIAQGRLEALLVFQTMVQDLTGMEVSNASLLDEGTAAAEAMAMAHRLSKGKRGHTFLVHPNCHPQTIAVVQTRAEPLEIDVVVADPATWEGEADVFGALLQYPGSDGLVEDPRPAIERIHAGKGLAILATDLLALTLLTPPGELGADIVVGSTQRFGVPMGYGGPHAAFLASSKRNVRAMAGRIIGVSKDVEGTRALRMALGTREQHIRREKATSNVCTAQVLLAVVAAMYAVWHGPEGLSAIAARTHAHSALLAASLRNAGLQVSDAFFDTVSVEVPDADALLACAASQGVDLRRLGANRVSISFDETTLETHVEEVLALFGAELVDEAADGIPDVLARSSAFLEHPVFHRYRSETEMLRYMHRLEAKDLALNTAMIPLGSCTMKLNATTEMIPITLPGFSQPHPFAPKASAPGYAKLHGDLEAWLSEITGFDAVSLQPNAGSQGEYAGLLVIRGFHEANGEMHRNVCLIPSSAHGTNPASAVMAGMEVVVVRCDDDGNIDVEDLREKAKSYSDKLAGLMVTYPSTHGVFEESIATVCSIVHEHGGQVYMDGANMNAMVGLCRPGDFGADVCHLNLHKTFCIPHGGGGPGMGPIGVKAHLAPFLPGHPVVEGVGGEGRGPVSAGPWGSPSILPISWAYIAMMGTEGLKMASQVAILAANYVAKRLEGHYDVLFTGRNGRVAHECIIDVRPFKAAGVTVDDIAKRLIDYGFHAPTMSWPVAGTLMIEPTESESLAELDRFIDAMIAIRGEVRAVEEGRWPADDNPLHHAPHTAQMVGGDEWEHAYPRSLAAWPSEATREWKFWPAVRRVDNVYGDKNLETGLA